MNPKQGLIPSILIQEAECILSNVDYVTPQLELVVSQIQDCKGHILLSGIGKSGLIAHKISSTMASLGIPSYFVHTTEALHGDLGIFKPEDYTILLSNSGETHDVVHLACVLTELSYPTIALTGNPQSSLAIQCTQSIIYRIDHEADPLNLAPTSSTTLCMAIGDALALAIAHHRKLSTPDFAKNHPAGTLGARARNVP